jgi:glycosyltransferase involved in cell wall biosynthesis
MHLVVAAHDFYPDPGSGGTGRYVYETGRALVDRGNSVSVITRRRGDVPERETVDGIDVYRYDIEVYGTDAADVFAQVPDAAVTVADRVEALGDPDLASFQGPVTAALVDAALPDAVPRSCTFHSPWPAEYAIKTRTTGSPTDEPREFHVRLRNAIEQHVLDRAAAATTLSEYMRDQLRETYDDPPPTAVVPGGVDADRFHPDAGPVDQIDAADTAVLTVRRMTPRMGHDRLLTAFADVADERPDAHLYLAGDGPIREALEARAADLGIADRTTFLGYVPEEDLPATYASADVFALPTRELEGFGLATLEALASGTPVVGTAVGATPELLEPLERADAITAPLVVADDEDALAHRMRQWTSLTDRALAEAGEACRSYARSEYSWERTADRLVDRYESLLR